MISRSANRKSAAFYVVCIGIAVFAAAAFWEFFLESPSGEVPSEPASDKLFETLFITAIAVTIAGFDAYYWVRSTERLQRVSAELERKARLLRVTLETMDQGICVYDSDLRLAAWNERYSDLSGQPADAPKEGRTALDMIRELTGNGVLQGEDVEQLAIEREKYYFRSGLATYEQRERADGRIIDIRRNPMPDGGYVSTFTDISALKAVEEQLIDAKERAENANRAKSSFLAQMSHELRTPLNAILGFSDVIARDDQERLSREKVRELAKDVHFAGSHLLALVNDILEVSAIEAGDVDIKEEDIDVTQLIQSTIKLIAVKAEAKEITIHFHGEDLNVSLNCDVRRSKQALLNVLDNAVKFTPKGGMVSIQVSSNFDGNLNIEISDTGPGIPERDLARIIQPFEQAEHSAPNEGVGLGLAIVKTIMVKQGGHLGIESSLGVGTKVILSFPAERLTSGPSDIALKA